MECDHCGKEFEYTEADKVEDNYPDYVNYEYSMVLSDVVRCKHCDDTNRLTYMGYGYPDEK